MEPTQEKHKPRYTVEQLSAAFTETEQVILSRRSVRAYRKEQVPEFMVKRILEAGRFAPSAGNAQPWKFVVLREPQVIQELTNTVTGICRTFRALIDYRRPGWGWLSPLVKPFIRIRHNDLHPVPFGAVSNIALGKLGLWHGAPTVILIFKDVRGVSSPDLDCGIAGQNMVLAAHSMGLGTCWVGFAKLAFQYSTVWKRRMKIGFPYEFANSLCVGWPLGAPDGMIERQTHPVDWYEDGTVRTVDPAENNGAKIGLLDRFKVPTYHDPVQIKPGEISIDHVKCTSCGMCRKVCPADCIELIDRKPVFRSEPFNECIFCADCAAVCPAGAITMVTPYRYTGYYTTIDAGEKRLPRL